MHVAHEACQTVDGLQSMCFAAAASASTDSSALPGILFGPTALGPLGLMRDNVSHTCSPWPLVPLSTNAMVVKGMALALGRQVRITRRL